jgi:hypothetical protein
LDAKDEEDDDSVSQQQYCCMHAVHAALQQLLSSPLKAQPSNSCHTFLCATLILIPSSCSCQ